MMKINNKLTFLVTTVSLNTSQIINMVKNNNLFGEVIVGCQKSSKDFFEEYFFDNLHLQIYYQTSVGTSRNRNFLLSKVNSEYCMFLDDDITFLDNNLDNINDALSKYPDFDFVFLILNIKIKV